MATRSIATNEPPARSRRTARATASGRAVADLTAAGVCLVYLQAMLLVFAWLLFDTWVGQHSLARGLGYNLARLDTPNFRLMIYCVLGGAIGAIVNGLRSGLQHYSGFDQRYIWKYITAPWMGATLGLVVYALLHSSIVLFGGSAALGDIGTAQALANFSAGALAGYGSKDVYIWLDAQVQKLFQVPQEVPDVTGQPAAMAASRLHSENLEVGTVVDDGAGPAEASATVVTQSPAPHETVARGDAVDLQVTGQGADGTG